MLVGFRLPILYVPISIYKTDNCDAIHLLTHLHTERCLH